MTMRADKKSNYGLAMNVDTNIKHPCDDKAGFIPGMHSSFQIHNLFVYFCHIHRFKERNHLIVSILAYRVLDKY